MSIPKKFKPAKPTRPCVARFTNQEAAEKAIIALSENKQVVSVSPLSPPSKTHPNEFVVAWVEIKQKM